MLLLPDTKAWIHSKLKQSDIFSSGGRGQSENREQVTHVFKKKRRWIHRESGGRREEREGKRERKREGERERSKFFPNIKECKSTSWLLNQPILNSAVIITFVNFITILFIILKPIIGLFYTSPASNIILSKYIEFFSTVSCYLLSCKQ